MWQMRSETFLSGSDRERDKRGRLVGERAKQEGIKGGGEKLRKVNGEFRVGGRDGYSES